MAATPPTTPPAMAPTGVDEPESGAGDGVLVPEAEADKDESLDVVDADASGPPS